MRIAEIWRYPVKSLGGERLDAATIGPNGIEGDRMWGVHDPATGMILTARREPALLFLSAAWRSGDRPRIVGDDGRELADDEALSRWIRRPVELRSVADGPGMFENPMNVDDESDWKKWQSNGVTFHDGRSTISFASHDSLGEWDRRRFRLNLILDGGGEDDLTEDVMAGSAALRVRKPLERCVMITRAQPGIEQDRSVLKRVIAERSNQLGIGAVVTEPGVIAVGDELR